MSGIGIVMVVGVACGAALLSWRKMAPIPVITIATMVIAVVAADGLRRRRRRCRCDHPHCGSRRLTFTIVIATVAIIIPDVLLIVVGVAHGSSLHWWSTWVVVV